MKQTGPNRRDRKTRARYSMRASVSSEQVSGFAFCLGSVVWESVGFLIMCWSDAQVGGMHRWVGCEGMCFDLIVVAMLWY